MPKAAAVVDKKKSGDKKSSEKTTSKSVKAQRFLVSTKKEHLFLAEFKNGPESLDAVQGMVKKMDLELNGEEGIIGWKAIPFDIDYYELDNLEEFEEEIGDELREKKEKLEEMEKEMEEMKKRLEELEKKKKKLASNGK